MVNLDVRLRADARPRVHELIQGDVHGALRGVLDRNDAEVRAVVLDLVEDVRDAVQRDEDSARAEALPRGDVRVAGGRTPVSNGDRVFEGTAGGDDLAIDR